MSCSGLRGITSISAWVFPNRLRCLPYLNEESTLHNTTTISKPWNDVFVCLCAVFQFSDMCFGLEAGSISHLRLFTFWYFVTSLRKNPSPNKGKRRRAGLVIDVISLATSVNALGSRSWLVGRFAPCRWLVRAAQEWATYLSCRFHFVAIQTESGGRSDFLRRFLTARTGSTVTDS